MELEDGWKVEKKDREMGGPELARPCTKLSFEGWNSWEPGTKQDREIISPYTVSEDKQSRLGCAPATSFIQSGGVAKAWWR